MKKLLLNNYAGITGLLVFIIYLATLSPTVTEFDSGELITVQATLGISHPTGYPLFTMIGYLFSIIPLPFSIAYKLNLLCAIWCAATIVILINTIKFLLDNKDELLNKTSEPQSLIFSNSEFVKKVTAISTGLLFAFSYTFWAQATKVEVYSLQLFLSSMIMYFAFKASLTPDTQLTIKNKIITKDWLIVAIFVGLGFSNHMMTMYLLPFIVYLFFKKNKLEFASARKFFLLTLLSVMVSVILYLYLLLSAQMSSGLNFWLEPNLVDWINHIRGKIYQGLIVESLGETSKQFKAFGESLMVQLDRESRRGGDFSINIVFIFAGIIISAFTTRKLFYALILIVLTAFSISMSYAILDIQEYFLLIFFSFSFFWGICIYFILSIKKIESNRVLRILIPAILISALIFNNFKEIDRSDNYLYEDYINSVLDSMEPNTVLLTNQWDYIEAPAVYFQEVEGRRLDLEVINLELLTFDSYVKAMKQKDKIHYDSANDYVDIYPLLNSNKTYITSEVIRDYIQEQRLFLDQTTFLVPDILLFKIVKSKNYISAADPDFNIRIPKYKSAVDNHIINLVGSMLVNRIRYELSFNKVDRAKVYYSKLLNDFPMYNPPQEFNFLKN